ncbi:hypothetical protein C8R46DRAFT_1118471 [Mycena filopes]|nr:hypothetical protein C8R46DRAFT_1118471 [Mycena filopes]
MSATTTTKRLHISFTPSVPASGTRDPPKFATVKAVDGLGELDGVGVPKKFGFVSIEGSETNIAKCVSSLSGSIWKGVKVRVGDARPNFDQRFAEENVAEEPPAKRRRKRSGVHAEDMTPVTAETAAHQPGWKVSETGSVVRPVRIRPERPLPPPSAPSESSTGDGAEKRKSKKLRDPDSRARLRTIDMARWGSVHLKGALLEDAEQPVHEVVAERGHDDTSASEEDLPDKTGDGATRTPDANPITFVPMDVDGLQNSKAFAIPSSNPTEVAHKPTQATKLKDLFVSKEDDVGFSLLGYLDLELDEEVPPPIQAAGEPALGTTADAVLSTIMPAAQAYIALDPKQLLFFPLLASFSSTTSTKARQRDILDVGRDNGWDAHFRRTESEEEIRADWEGRKGGLTREWNRRWREAGKVRRRRGGGDGD